jgi:hypothetical protein
MHYGVGVVPARPYKPRDKAKVESGVLLAQRWIIAALRHRKLFSIEELNQASASCATASTSGRSASGKAREHRSSRLSTSPRSIGCLPSRSISASGLAHGSTSTITSSSTPTTTACRTTWCRNWWKCARRLRRSSFSTRASVWLRICARVVMGAPSLFPSTVHPPSASGMDSVTHGALGTVHWSAHSPPF